MNYLTNNKLTVAEEIYNQIITPKKSINNKFLIIIIIIIIIRV